jgi:hypothetical protein
MLHAGCWLGELLMRSGVQFPAGAIDFSPQHLYLLWGPIQHPVILYWGVKVVCSFLNIIVVSNIVLDNCKKNGN